MKFLSVCSGIEAASVAWKPLGWKAVGFSEIEPFPCAVLAHHYPDVRNFGDLTKWEGWIDDVADFDVLAGGTPCQGFSVAGRRGGLDDPRSQLAFDFLGIAGRRKPQWVVWENVPGVLSSDDGRDFGAFLGELGKCGYGFAYRVLDAQYFGLAQRRKRVFVVGYLGDWRPAAAVLLEPESLRGDSAPSREAGEGTAGSLAARTKGGGPGCARTGDSRGQDPVIAHGFSNRGAEGVETLRSDSHGATPMVAHSLRAEGHDASEDGTGRGVPLTSMCIGTSTQRLDPTQETMIPVAYGWNGDTTPKTRREQSPTLRADQGGEGVGVGVGVGMAVRRLTPRECERLQGFPDDYTLVPHRGKPAADGPRYKALGNSWATPCARWIGERIAAMKETK